jgi:hypothetical protein
MLVNIELPEVDRIPQLHLWLLATRALCYKRFRLLDECLLHDLSKPRQRELIQDLQAFGQLEPGDLLLQEKVRQFLQGERHPWPQNHEGTHELSQLRIGHRHTGDVEDGGMRQDQVARFIEAISGKDTRVVVRHAIIAAQILSTYSSERIVLLS